jgi:hypothetical protein
MMTNNQDQLLQSVFAEARQDLDGEVLTARIMTKTRRMLYLLATGGITLALILLAGVWLMFGIPRSHLSISHHWTGRSG